MGFPRRLHANFRNTPNRTGADTLLLIYLPAHVTYFRAEMMRCQPVSVQSITQQLLQQQRGSVVSCSCHSLTSCQDDHHSREMVSNPGAPY